MKCIILFAAFGLALAEIEFFTTANDHLDMDALVANKLELQSFLDCFLDRAPCTELMESYKRLIPDCVKEACRRCNPNQRYQLWRYLEGLKASLPDGYVEFRQHFDPKSEYFDKLEYEISKYVRPDMDLID